MPNFAQEPMQTYGPKKKEQGPRAVGVLEWTPQGARLVPITIKIADKFYDAGIYQAQPIPMAIDTGVVYEVQKAGESLGDFTLEAAQQTENGAWVGVGKFDSKAAQDKRREDSAKRAAAAASAKAQEDKEDRPVLHRSKPKSAEASPSTPTAPSTTPAPVPGSSPTPTAESTPEAKPAPTPLTDNSGDPNRPILKRGKEKEEQAIALDNKPIPMKKPTPPPPGLTNIQVAVSDATAGQQPHEYKWSWANPEEEKKLRGQAEKLALATVAEYAAKLGSPKPGKLEDVTMSVYDLSYSNAPDVILSARVLPEAKPVATKKGAKPAEVPAVPPGLEYYVTIVGREDIYAQLQKSYATATDNKHLDAFPRMQLIDVVDVDGNGAGDLLFRSINDTGSSFVIYRDLGYRLDEVIRVPEPKS